MRNKKHLIALILFLALTGGFCFFYFGFQRDAKRVHYRTILVERGEVRATISGTGTINPISLVLVGSQVSGRIQYLYADFNSRVKKGQMVAQIEPDLFKAQVANAHANLNSAQANLKISKVEVKDSERTMKRKKELLSHGLISQGDYDVSEAAYDSVLAQLDVSRARLSQAQASLESDQTNLDHTVITSPVNGVVISRHVDIGQTVAASFQAPTLFTIAEDLKRMQLSANVDEADIGQVTQGQEATFTVDAYPQETFSGKVSQVRNAPNIVQNVVTYDVMIQVGNPQLKLKPGMTANVSILVARSQRALKVPNEALRFRPPSLPLPSFGGNHQFIDRSRGSVLWTLGSDGQPQRVKVELGISDGVFTELKKGFLQEGQEVIVEPLGPENRQPKKNRGGRSRSRPF